MTYEEMFNPDNKNRKLSDIDKNFFELNTMLLEVNTNSIVLKFEKEEIDN